MKNSKPMPQTKLPPAAVRATVHRTRAQRQQARDNRPLCSRTLRATRVSRAIAAIAKVTRDGAVSSRSDVGFQRNAVSAWRQSRRAVGITPAVRGLTLTGDLFRRRLAPKYMLARNNIAVFATGTSGSYVPVCAYRLQQQSQPVRIGELPSDRTNPQQDLMVSCADSF